MKVEYVLMKCDECDRDNKYNHMISTKKNYSLTFCHDCLQKLNKKIKDYVEEENEK